MQKVASVKEARKRRGKGQKKAMAKIVQILAYAHTPNKKYFTVLYLIFWESISLVKK